MYSCWLWLVFVVWCVWFGGCGFGVNSVGMVRDLRLLVVYLGVLV